MNVKRAARYVLMSMMLIYWFSGMATAKTALDMPQELAEWKSWVLYGHEEAGCPADYHKADRHRCLWPSRFRLDADSHSARFEQEWRVFAATWASLPGSQGMWPNEVLVDGAPIPVVERDGAPVIWLTPGKHTGSGVFKFSEMPEMLRIPPDIGLVDLTINNQRIDFPVLDKQGRLWLQKRTLQQVEENRLGVVVYRLVEDDIPMTVVNHFNITVSGRAREIRLDNVLLPHAIPMELKSPLPARIGESGDLKLQARPGKWNIQIVSRFDGETTTIGPVPGTFGQEIWAFKPFHHLRMVKIESVPAIDPTQTDIPNGWKQYATYIVEPEATVEFEVLRRGDPEPAPDQLSLDRTWWLDFNGKGYTIHDEISGAMKNNWRLSMNSPAELGRVSVNGEDRLITVHGPENNRKPGVELRRGELTLAADARIEGNTRRLNAVGWDHDFQSVSARLNLPPGWRLFTAGGIDEVPGTWFRRWTLFDFFLVLIIGIAVMKLKDRRWGLLAIITLALIYHEPGAPRMIWLWIIAALGLLQVLPQGGFRKFIVFLGFIFIAALLVVSIPFMVWQVRQGMYPQLDRMYGGLGSVGSYVAYKGSTVRGSYDYLKSKSEPAEPAEEMRLQQQVPSNYQMTKNIQIYQRKQAIFTHDPNALVQTGPGLPDWEWRSYSMRWNGPVDKNQTIRLVLIPPIVNFILSFLRVILLALLIFGLIDLRFWFGKIGDKLTAAVFLVFLIPMVVNAQSYPSNKLLDDLQKRLLESEDCYPRCADIQRMALTADAHQIRIVLEVHALSETSIPLPGSLDAWMPDNVLLDTAPLDGLMKDDAGILWALTPKGIHRFVLVGKAGATHTLQIPMPLRPHQATVDADGWDVQGVHRDGTVESGIQLTRIKQDGELSPIQGSILPPFFQVERILNIGLTWEVFTSVRRLTPKGSPAAVAIPLLEGESVTTGGIQVENGQALINMDPASDQVEWISTLKMAPEIHLRAPEKVPWTEKWILDASTIWHCSLSGISVIHHQDQSGLWRPEWRPWPGETVDIAISRPEAVTGQIVTIDYSNLDWTPGRRYNKAALTLIIRSSRGEQHDIILPENALLQLVEINDKSRPIRQDGQKVTIPLQPGKQIIRIEWHQPAESRFLVQSPKVKIGEKAVNVNVTFHMGTRWILFVMGPKLGPAVLFWSYLFVIVIAAIGLGRIEITPLNTSQWLLLSLGLTQIHPLGALIIVGWFIVLGIRKQWTPPENKPVQFDFIQIALAGWTLVMLGGLLSAIWRGLLQIPRMQIAGNGSNDYRLYWMQDRIVEFLPQPWAFTLPMVVYRILMLLWALWLAISLLQWLKWGWEAFSAGGLWKKITFRKKKTPTAS